MRLLSTYYLIVGDRVYLYVGLCSTYLPTYFLFVNADSLGLMVEKPHRNIRTFTKLHKYFYHSAEKNECHHCRNSKALCFYLLFLKVAKYVHMYLLQ